MCPLTRRCTPQLVIAALLVLYGSAIIKGDAEAEREKRLIGSVYLVPSNQHGPQRGMGGTRLTTSGRQFVMFQAPGNSRLDGCYFIKSLELEDRRLRILTSPDGERGIGYDLTGESKLPRYVVDPEAQEWLTEPGPDPKTQAKYLRVANGKLKGWYLNFEEPPLEDCIFVGTSRVFVKFWKAVLTPEPGPMSAIRFTRSPFRQENFEKPMN